MEFQYTMSEKTIRTYLHDIYYHHSWSCFVLFTFLYMITNWVVFREQWLFVIVEYFICILFMLGLIWSLGILFVSFFTYWYKKKGIYMPGNYYYHINQDGVEERFGQTDRFLVWDNLKMIKKTKHCIILLFKKGEKSVLWHCRHFIDQDHFNQAFHYIKSMMNKDSLSKKLGNS